MHLQIQDPDINTNPKVEIQCFINPEIIQFELKHSSRSKALNTNLVLK